MKQYIAFKGIKYTIEWYYNQNGNSQALDYFKEMDNKQKEKIFFLFKTLDIIGKIQNKEKFNYEGNSIYAFKPIPDRFLCFFFEGNKIVITNAFEKKQQKLPQIEKEKSLKAKSDYEKRIKEGNYYE
jgi:hypothetical protein